MKCFQDGCMLIARFRYTWPGKPEAFACGKHAAKADSIARAMGFFMEIKDVIPAPGEDDQNLPPQLESSDDE